MTRSVISLPRAGVLLGLTFAASTPSRASVAPIAMETAAAAAPPLRMCRLRFQGPFWKQLSRQCQLILLFVCNYFIALILCFGIVPKANSAPRHWGPWGGVSAPAPSGWRWKARGSRGYGDHCHLQTGPVSCSQPWEGPRLIEVARIMKPKAFEASRPVEAKNNWTNSLSGWPTAVEPGRFGQD